MNVVVTGAAGYMGSRLTRLLAATPGYDVFAIDRVEADCSSIAPCVKGVLQLSGQNDYEAIRPFFQTVRPEAVCHLAALVRVRDEEQQMDDLLHANVHLGTYLLQAGVGAGLRFFVHTGSFWETMDSSEVYRPVDLYAATKRAFHDVLVYYTDRYGLRSMTLRMFGMYGPDDPRGNIFTLFEKSIDAAEPIDFSPGHQALDLLFVEDAARAYLCALRTLAEAPGGAVETVEIGTGQCLSLREIADIYQQARGRPLRIRWEGRPYRPREVMRRCADTGKALEQIGWRPQIDLQEGIRRVVEALVERTWKQE